MTETLTLLQQLIRKPSITPDDAGCQDLLAHRLVPLGFSDERMNFADTQNQWLRRGQNGPLLVFLGHTDVVPPGPAERWQSPPFEPVIRDGKLYGRGAADMKGGIAAFVTALERFLAKHPDQHGSIAIMMTSDEEGPSTHGTVKVVEVLQARGETIDWCLVGEPSSNQTIGDVIRVGRRGSLCAKLTVYGIQGHVAYPELADNPIHALAPALAELTQEVWDHGNAFFPPTRLQVSNIDAGNGAENIIPGQVELLFNLRFSSELDAATIKSRIHALLDRHGLNYDIIWRLSGDPFLTTHGELIAATHQAIEAVCGYRPQNDTGGGTSDGRFVAPTGAQVVELGPVNASIHKIDEHIGLDELETLSDIYYHLLENLLT
ncbi:MAG: succinyl-diaminopimelate desuccinylase [Methylomonas sp.]|nr:succinyl-diaminopimelate desuccinylase [Methylomonas sp.]PPD20560.1 MAG: succinyl-diaminopimelate desuccinylase [Methylomonas sp.]PPD26574.1 MAG: succinyl-diaminopimelate desuccinylase [Methylomonas sp.]PPD38369.1 MAG: succinyl-diaminopimelate desuccinylase [Methylomonas sp.]PPD42839.1 MAG: succinyl-diaminopimelate desuccinylase [Methylomonas sp.]